MRLRQRRRLGPKVVPNVQIARGILYSDLGEVGLV